MACTVPALAVKPDWKTTAASTCLNWEIFSSSAMWSRTLSRNFEVSDGVCRTISARSATTLTVSSPFPYPIAPTDSYLIGSATATVGTGKLTTAVTPSSTAKGAAKVSLAGGSAEFTSTAPGSGNNYNYELLALRDLTPLSGSFDTSFDYTITSGLIPADSSLPYLYLMSSYAGLRFDFQAPAGKRRRRTRGSSPARAISRIAPNQNGFAR